MDNKDKFIVMAVGRQIQHTRINIFDWTQETLAGYSGLSSKHISLIEKGKRNIRITTLRKIAQAFDMTVQELCDFELHSKKETYHYKHERF